MSSFIKNIAKLTAGTTVSQILNVVLMPIITRMFLPEAFGDLAVFTSITLILGSIITMRYELAIVLPKEESKGINLLALCLIITFLMSIIFFSITISFGNALFRIFNLSIDNHTKYYISLMLLFTGIFVSFDNWCIRKGYFGLISTRRVFQSVVTQISRIGFGLAGYVTGSFLIVSVILGQIIASFSLVFNVFKKDGYSFRKNINKKSIIELAKRYKDFPKYYVLSTFLNVASQNEPVLFLAYFFDASVVGYYALGRQALGVPMGFIGKSIGQVFFQKATQAYQDGSERFAYTVEHMFDKLVLLSLYPFLVLTFFGKELFVFVFGQQWTEAGVYVQILSIPILINFTSTIISLVMTVAEKQKQILYMDVVFFIARSLALCSAFFVKDARKVIFIYALVETLCRILHCLWPLYIAKVSFLNVFRNIIVVFVMTTLVLMIIKTLNISFGYLFILILSVGAFIYYFVVVMTNKYLKKKVLRIVYNNWS